MVQVFRVEPGSRVRSPQIRSLRRSRLEACADPLQKRPYFLAKGMNFGFVDQPQGGIEQYL